MSECGRNCGCKASVSRRDVLKVGAGAAGLLIAGGSLSAADGDIPPAGHVPPPKEWWDELAKPGPAITYTGENLKRLIFPLGGIGTGTIWLHGFGRLVNWQIFNNIQKNSLVDDTFFAVRIEQKGKPPVVRVLQQDSIGSVAGFRDIRFTGQYPIATMRFADPEIPAEIELEAFNPLIPLDERRSGLPCIFFTVRVKNTSADEMRVSTLFSVQNAVGHAGAGRSTGVNHASYGGNVNSPLREGNLTAVVMSAEPAKRAESSPAAGVPETSPSSGTMCLAMGNLQATVAAGWTDSTELFKGFIETGGLGQPGGEVPGQAGPTGAGKTINTAMCMESAAPVGGTAESTFVLAWHFPHQYYPQSGESEKGKAAVEVGNMYANWFNSALNVARQALADHDTLRAATFAFRDAMFDTTLPQYLIDAVAANVSIIRSPTCFWTKDNTFYGYEGCGWDGGGCCPMNCNHVWNYEQTLSKLWPGLERNMRVTELDYNQLPDGGIHHRVSVPRDNSNNDQIPVADGQCGAVLKAYREHLQSPDSRFLDEHWGRIKKAMDHAITSWDSDADGIMDKPQFNTYDAVIYGQNTFVSSLYLAALRAAEEMAKLSKDEASAKRYRELFEKGSKKIAETLFDGEYYIQKADDLRVGYGKGCCSDQVVGQWWARILNLGDILPNEQVQSALKAIFKHNMLWTQEGFQGTQRFREFADGKDKGLLICSWPKGGRPSEPILYRDEIWTGVEYQVAGHKLYEGQVEEALAIVRSARERYNGIKKSPWNEIECGDYYVRAMSSWSLLLGAQGYVYNGPQKSLALRPRLAPDNHRSMFTTAEAWGRFEQHRDDRKQTDTLTIMRGRCELAELRFGLPKGAKSVSGEVRLKDAVAQAKISLEAGDAVLQFSPPAVVKTGQTLSVALTWA